MNASLGELAAPVAKRIEQLQRERVVQRIWERDTSLWPGDPEAIRLGLGWLTVADAMEGRINELTSFAEQARADGLETAVVLGMGGSSLAPAVLAHAGPRRLLVLDSTHPRSIEALKSQVDIDRTLFVVASKSGSTLETLTFFDYFWAETGHSGRQFVAVTDEGSALDELAQERRFRQVFLNPPDIGGRFSALSYFGLVPAALARVDLGQLIGSATERFAECRATDVSANPAAILGATLAEAALAGRNKLALEADGTLPGFESWVEQLVAESTGKQGRGILPVPVKERTLIDDQLFISISESESASSSGLTLKAGPSDLGGEFARWEFATAVASHILGVQPFNQPDVQAAKDATDRALAGNHERPGGVSVGQALGSVSSGGYVALLAFLPDTAENRADLSDVGESLSKRTGVATTVGFGPRYLHSTGQFHKGAPNNGVFIVLEDGDDGVDVPIPGRSYSFRDLISAQADGDVATLTARGRTVARSTVDALKEFLDD